MNVTPLKLSVTFAWSFFCVLVFPRLLSAPSDLAVWIGTLLIALWVVSVPTMLLTEAVPTALAHLKSLTKKD